MVEPVTVVVLTGLGAAAASVAGWFAGRTQQKRDERAVHQAADAARKRPNDLPEITPAEAGAKWMKRIQERFARKAADDVEPPPTTTDRKTVTQRVVRTLNLLEPVFALLVAGLVVWVAVRLARPEWTTFLPGWAVPLATASAVGYGTNWVALKMLFHPQRANKVWQGVIPNRRAQLVEAISDSVIERLIGPEIIRRYLHESDLLREVITETSNVAHEVVSDPEFRQDVKAVLYDMVAAFATSEETKDAVADAIEEQVNSWTGTTLGTRLAAAFKPLWGPVIKREVLRALPELPHAVEHAFGRIEQRLMAVPDWIESRQGRIEAAVAEWVSVLLHRIDFKPIIEGELNKMSPDQLEEMLSNPLSAELTFVKTSGGLFGLVVAAAILWWQALIGVVAVAALLAVAYAATVKPAPAADRTEIP